MSLPPFLKTVNFNGVSNKRPSRISHAQKEKEMMLIVMKMLYLYPLEVLYNFELRFSQNVIKNGCMSLSFLAACRIKGRFHDIFLRAHFASEIFARGNISARRVHSTTKSVFCISILF